ncbi:hypothetical protein [Roseicyclus sp.]|uniref:hypothetical protein n=1 Tax=Roseicyclus sp. TaxID=1914329 RepID=UPI003F9F22EC
MMKVFVFDDDPAVLDLVAHFLGIAVHDNVNAPPSGLARPAERRVLGAVPLEKPRSGM